MATIERFLRWTLTWPSSRVCESCGRAADVMLRDGSTWCLGCDLSARNQGYDNAPAKMLTRNRGRS